MPSYSRPQAAPPRTIKPEYPTARSGLVSAFPPVYQSGVGSHGSMFLDLDANDLVSVGERIQAALEHLSDREIIEGLSRIGIWNHTATGLIKRVRNRPSAAEEALGVSGFEMHLAETVVRKVSTQIREAGYGNREELLTNHLKSSIEFAARFPRRLNIPSTLLGGCEILTIRQKADLRLLVGQIYSEKQRGQLDIGKYKSLLLQIGANHDAVDIFMKSLNLSRETNEPPHSAAALNLLEREPHPILYLRAFRDDDQNLPWHKRFRNNSERILIRQLQDHGEFVAIGQPGETGCHSRESARLFVPDESWRDIVRLLMLRAERIVIRMANTDGLMWEFRELLKLVEPQRMIIVTPEGRRKTDREQTVDFIASEMRDHWGTEVAPRDWPLVIGFDYNQTPRFIGHYDHLRVALTHSIADEMNRYLFLGL